MGFGTFFIGYFLLLDIAYYTLTDAIAAAVMLLGLSRLARFNRGFKAAFASCVAFLAFSLTELGFWVAESVFSAAVSPETVSYMAIVRAVLLCTLTLTSFEGMRDISAEVGLGLHAKRCRITAYSSLPVYVLAIVAETPALFEWTDAKTATLIGVISLLISFTFVIFNLFSIYTCYARICMPEENRSSQVTPAQDKPKGESFLDAYRRQRAEREEFRASRLKEKKENKEGKK